MRIAEDIKPIYRIHEDTVFVLGVFDDRRDLEDVILSRLLSL